MAKVGLAPIYQRPRTTVLNPEYRIFPYLLGEMVVDRPSQVWCAEMIYLPMWHGSLYLVAVMDWANAGGAGLRVPNTAEVEICLEALDEAMGSSVSPRSAIPNKAACSPRRGSPACCSRLERASQWTGAAVGWTMSSLGTLKSRAAGGRTLVR